MKLVLRYARALEVLDTLAKPFGIDRVVRRPLQQIQTSLNISYNTALTYLNELERRNAIVIVKDTRDGKSIEEARILVASLPLRVHEKSDTERVLGALWKYKTKATTAGLFWIVPSGFFPQVHGDADVRQARLYIILSQLEQRGWIEIRRDEFSTRERILFVKLTDSFPKVN